ncbi:peptidoglycan/xylan/chitin deacetylase (PgdA/CDA1 family) [Mumia flava]|uniref:Peptidoglycan/xylan/chitin deacetylase (PgdA/CDA1 family) n=1 Tax=Mumia flava TaxID=1348852 RepID=A0A2M9B8P6_9ACTN|nr:polysaccharide deacetylase [Mumia flava]PJJ54329.1 peptidoglycan/xylan/chitin deacetylase (PgdA/CDA1 family) [Mumia flava]
MSTAPTTDVSDWAWPHGKDVAVSLTFDVDAEAGWLGEGEEYARRLTILSEGRYGVVRGVPRILDLLDRYAIPATFFVPGYTAETHPDLVRRLLDGGHEVAHHGYLHLRSDHVDAAAQTEEIDRGLEALAKAGADDVTGYRSTSWELTPETFDLLVDRGFGYDSSCMGDDRPYVESWDGREILEIPVHWSLDDWPRYGWNIDGGGNVADPAEMRRSWLAEFDSAVAEHRHTSFTMHPEVIGRPYRLAELEAVVARIAERDDVWWARLDEVAAHTRPLLGLDR